MYLEVSPSGSKVWRMAYRQQNGKSNRLTFGTYPEVSLAEARGKRAIARKPLSESIDPAQHKRDEKSKHATANGQSFEVVARVWLAKTAADRAPSTQQKNTNWLEKNIFPYIGAMPIASIKPADVLSALRRIEARGAFESTHKIKQLCGQVFRFGVASSPCERDVAADLRGALASVPEAHYAAITDPVGVAPLLRAIHSYSGHPYGMGALQLAPLVFARPGELRSAEWKEFDLTAAEWRIPAVKMKMSNDHIVPLSKQALVILIRMQTMTGGERYVFPSIRTSDRCMSENTINAA